MATQIGTIELLRMRVYGLDAECYCDTGSTVVVEPGEYPLYSDGLSTFWVMRGELNKRGIWRMGDGKFGTHPADEPSGIEVTFPSKRFGPDEWAALLTEPSLTEGHADQRLRVRITAGVES